MVLFITGRCSRTCWYCPLAKERKGYDTIFANEREIHSPNEAIDEARLMSALGTSITGGEPLLVLNRLRAYATALKETFGPSHHIHLYTALAPDTPTLLSLRKIVDEIRFHPPPEEWPAILNSEFLEAVTMAKQLGFSAGFEVPGLKGVNLLEPALPLLDFLNINELEWGELSANEMRSRGLEPIDGLHNAVRYSVKWSQPLRHHRQVHFCPSQFKDSVQLRERLKRIARNTARSFDEVTDDGTIVYGVIEGASPEERHTLDLDPGDYEECGDQIELSWQTLKRKSQKITGRKYIIERYPPRGIVVELTPL